MLSMYSFQELQIVKHVRQNEQINDTKDNIPLKCGEITEILNTVQKHCHKKMKYIHKYACMSIPSLWTM